VLCAAIGHLKQEALVFLIGEDDPQLMEVIAMFKLRQLRCSFCRKSENEISKLVAGPRVYICDQCVAIASQIMEGDSNGSHPPEAEASAWGRLLARVRQLLRGDAHRVSAIDLS
jgi:ClpX C4-type zinc finger